MAKLFRALFIVSLLVPVAAFAQTADQEVVSAVDAPDPVLPGAVLTYTVTLTNHGPDPATGGGLNINLPLAVTHQNSVPPAGFTCFYLGSNGTCNMPSLPVGTYVITINVVVGSHLAAFPDQDITANFFPSGTTVDPNNANNAKLVTTSVDSPQVDLQLTASDSPDPVFPDGVIEYTVDVTNAGPDTASTVNFNAVPTSSLAFHSVDVPTGWSCVTPAVGALNATFTCSRATWAPGTSQFVVRWTANDENIGILDTTLLALFSVGANASNETNHTNNQETETTQYTTADADMNIIATESPDPVFPDGDITYTVTVTNQGPDAAPNARMTIVGNGGQTRFVSLSGPGDWTCSPPAPGTLLNVAGYDCTNPSFASGGVAVFTVVTEASDDLHPNSDHNVTQAFTTSSSVADPDGTDNAVTVTTAYVVPDADMNITASDSPDPVSPDGNITYIVTVTNQGPDTATNAKMTVVGNGGQTRFQSITEPAGWSCAEPAPGTLLNVANFDCTNPSFANGAVAVFTVVTTASDDLHPNSDHNITQAFTTSADEADPDGPDNSVTVTTTYDVPNADLSVTNADSPDPVSPGDTITYTQSIQNGGPDTATDATFNQTLPASVGFQSMDIPAGWSCTTPAVGASGAINCSNASFANGSTSNFSVVVTVLALSGTITNTVTAGTSASDPDPTDDSATVVTTILTPLIADLGISKFTTSDDASPGASVAYTITLTNNGPDAAANVVVTDTLEAGLLFQSITVPAGFNCATPAAGANGTITCTAASMASGTTAVFTLVVQLTSNAVGPINNTAGATSDTEDDNAGNDTGSASPVAVPSNGTADLSVSKSTQTTTAAPGDTVTYTISVTNNGPHPASDIIVNDELPASLLFQSITPAAGFTCTTPAVGATGTITCLGGPLANGATATFTLVTTIAPSASGSIVNGVVVSTSDSDPVSGNSSGTTGPVVIANADLSISKTTTATQATTGSTITYTISVTNNGPDTATNVVVSDNLPSGLQFVSATPSQGSCAGTDPFTCNLGTLLNGASATISLQALVTATSGTVANTATVTADTDDGTPGNNTSTSPAIPVTPGAAQGAAIPTMSEWALLALAMMLGLAAVARMRM